jgi:Golgi SNAP receptor complex protein 2
LEQLKKKEEEKKRLERERKDLFLVTKTNPSSQESSSKTIIERQPLDESNVWQHTESHLDTFLATGRSILHDLTQQGSTMKTAHRRLLDAANSLGISGDIIRYIERRSTQDTWIFLALVVVLFFLMYLVLRFLW